MAYQAPWWLPGGHAQTIFASLYAPRAQVTYRRERWDTMPQGKPDGDFIDVDWVDGQAGQPVLVHFHGLEGSAQSPYALALMARCMALGWSGMVVNFRGCSGELNRLPRAYHSGDAAEIDWILRKVRQMRPDVPRFAVGVSLGGNALLKWLGEQASAATSVVTAAAAISAPVDLMAAGDALGQGFSANYGALFLKTMKTKSLAKLAIHPGIFDADKAMAARTLRAFDDVVTAPLHGFRDTNDYWTRASSKPGLVDVCVPTLVINAINDPFLPARALPSAREVSRQVTLDYPEQGGHVGFPSAQFPGRSVWMPERVFQFFMQG